MTDRGGIFFGHPDSSGAICFFLCELLLHAVPEVQNTLKFFPKTSSPGLNFCAGGFPSMSATNVWRAVLITLLLAPCLNAQSGATQSTTTCNLDDGRQVYIRYIAVPLKQQKIQNGKPLEPGGSAMTLFTEMPLSLGSSTIPIGAYTIYPIPSKGNWTVAVNKNALPAPPTTRNRTSPARRWKPHRSKHPPMP